MKIKLAERYEIFINLAKLYRKYENFVHLHLHTTYSFFDGFNRPEDSAKRAHELGMTAQAITDHNHLAGVPDFQKACKKYGIKPLLGYEGYHTWNSDIISSSIDNRYKLAIEEAKRNGIEVSNEKKPTKEDKEMLKRFLYDTTSYHILFIAKNQEGWKNLIQLQSESASRGLFNGRYHCDTEMMRKYKKGIIMTTACIQNTVNHLFITGEDQKAECLLHEWKDIYQDDFYVEIQPLAIEEQWTSNIKLLKWAKENNVKVVATNDVHYTLKEDNEDHDTLFAISLGRLKADTNRLKYSHDYWIRSYDEMIEAFSIQIESMIDASYINEEEATQYIIDVINALDETNRVAEKCGEIRIGSDVPIYPIFDTPKGISSETLLTNICYSRLYEYKKEKPHIHIPTYEKRLNEELEIINSKGFAPYMLIVSDYIQWANKNNAPTGPGRG